MTKTELLYGYELLKKIIDQYIQDNNISFITSEIAPNTFKGMTEYYNDHGQFLIYNGGDHGFLGEEYNLKFRALHDYMHIVYDLKFTYNDEKLLSSITAFDFMVLGRILGMNNDDLALVGNIVNAEIRGQIEYYQENKSFVDDQSKFIQEYLKVS